VEATEVLSAAPTPTDTASAGAAVVAPEPTGESGSQQPDREAEAAYVNDVFRSAVAARSTLKPFDAPEPDGESAPPPGDVKPSDTDTQPVRDQLGRFIPRRGVPEAVRAAEQEAEAVKAKLAELDPAKIREQAIEDYKAEQERARESAKLDEIAQTQAETVRRYRTLLEVPDHEISPEDYQWREDYKERLRQYPEVEQFHQTAAQLQIQEERAAFLGHQRQQLQSVAALPGVDPEKVRSTADYGEIGRHLYEAGKSVSAARIAELENEVRQLRLNGPNGLGAQRSPIGAGRSAAGAGEINVNERFRQALFGRAAG